MDAEEPTLLYQPHLGKGLLSVGQTFDQYEIVAQLGRGSMGEVYEARHTAIGSSYAIKLIANKLWRSEDARSRFRSEATVLARLNHPRIVRVDDLRETQGIFWFRMELVEGRRADGRLLRTLQDLMRASGRLPIAEARELTRQMLDALAYAHSKGVIHRDVKPANVLLTGDGMKMADFGLARAAGPEWMQQVYQSVHYSAHMQTAETLGPLDTATGLAQTALLGTYAFMSPEQKRGEQADERSDLFAVALICYQMLTGREQLSMTPPSRLVEGLDPSWDAWLAQGTEERAHRFKTALDMLAALPPAVAGQPAGGHRTPVPWSGQQTPSPWANEAPPPSAPPPPAAPPPPPPEPEPQAPRVVLHLPDIFADLAAPPTRESEKAFAQWLRQRKQQGVLDRPAALEKAAAALLDNVQAARGAPDADAAARGVPATLAKELDRVAAALDAAVMQASKAAAIDAVTAVRAALERFASQLDGFADRAESTWQQRAQTAQAAVAALHERAPGRAAEALAALEPLPQAATLRKDALAMVSETRELLGQVRHDVARAEFRRCHAALHQLKDCLGDPDFQHDVAALQDELGARQAALMALFDDLRYEPSSERRVELLKAIRASFPGAVSLLQSLGEVETAVKASFDEARKRLEDAMKTNLDEARARLVECRRKVFDNRQGEELARLEAQIDDIARFVAAREQEAQRLLAAGDPAAAAAALRKVLVKDFMPAAAPIQTRVKDLEALSARIGEVQDALDGARGFARTAQALQSIAPHLAALDATCPSARPGSPVGDIRARAARLQQSVDAFNEDMRTAFAARDAHDLEQLEVSLAEATALYQDAPELAELRKWLDDNSRREASAVTLARHLLGSAEFEAARRTLDSLPQGAREQRHVRTLAQEIEVAEAQCSDLQAAFDAAMRSGRLVEASQLVDQLEKLLPDAPYADKMRSQLSSRRADAAGAWARIAGHLRNGDIAKAEEAAADSRRSGMPPPQLQARYPALLRHVRMTVAEDKDKECPACEGAPVEFGGKCGYCAFPKLIPLTEEEEADYHHQITVHREKINYRPG